MPINVCCGAEMDSKSTIALESQDKVWLVRCQAVVVRMGERFGEFGIEWDRDTPTEDIENATQWHLSVCVTKNSSRSKEEPFEFVEDLASEQLLRNSAPPSSGTVDASSKDEEGSSTRPYATFNEVLPAKKTKKVVKLTPGTMYKVMVRCYHHRTRLWSAWSPSITTASLNPVVGRIQDIGEDYAQISWDRIPRDISLLAPEIDSNATRETNDIQNLELRLLREEDMSEEYCHCFPAGQRLQTIYRLTPGTAYIVLIRYDSLIHSRLNWCEVGRFYTQPPLLLSLVSCGEDVFTIGWKRGELPSDILTYTVQPVEDALYQIKVENEGINFLALELPFTQNTSRIASLTPGSSYDVCVRSVSKKGAMGCRSEDLKVFAAERPTLEVLVVGEKFTSFSWSRKRPVKESKLEYFVKCEATEYHQQKTVLLPFVKEKGDVKRQFHVEDLLPGTQYSVSIRTFLEDEWGLWTEPLTFSTNPQCALQLVERGENFFTVGWPETNTTSSSRPSIIEQIPAEERYNIVVSRLKVNGEVKVLEDMDVVRCTETPGFRVENLISDAIYQVIIRSWQFNPISGYEGWSTFSDPMVVRTLCTLTLHVVEIGEDCLSVVWHRGGVVEQSSKNEFTKYEIVVSSAERGERGLVCKQVLGLTYTVNNLYPNTAYEIAVRGYDDQERWGSWETLKVRTLAPVVSSIHEIGEDFVRLMWQRQEIPLLVYPRLDAEEDVSGSALYPPLNSTLISSYDIFVYAKEFLEADVAPHKESGYFAGGHSDVAHYHVVSKEHTSFRVTDLLPDREYVAVIRACSQTGKKGLWSQPRRFRTNSQFSIAVDSLSIGENSIHLSWSRDPQPMGDSEVELGDLAVTGQQLCIRGVNSPFLKDHQLAADLRELKIYGLTPASAYTIQLRVCNKAGHWGLWSSPVPFLTRGTITTQAVEVAENYAVIRWERRRVPNVNNYPTGKGQVTCYHLRVYNAKGIHTETFVGDGDCPYRVTDLSPDTYYCVELKANYNDEEWGMWSAPLWCLTMQTMQIQTKLISEEFCRLSILRPIQQRRLPSDDGNQFADGEYIVFGCVRQCLMLCVTSPIIDLPPNTSGPFLKRKFDTNSVPQDAEEHQLIYQTEFLSDTEITERTVPNLKPNTVYSVSVRSKLKNGEWGLWAPSLLFATVPTTCVSFQEIGENFLVVEWKRRAQQFPPQIDPEKVVLGMDNIGASRVRIREIGSSYQKMYSVNDSSKELRLADLKSSSTFGVSVQTYNDNYEWGVWSEESKARTVPSMEIYIPHISENSLWVSWTRITDFEVIDTDTYLNVNVQARSYELWIVGGGNFKYTKEMQTNALFFRGLQPDSVYSVSVRALFGKSKECGQWSTRWFRTPPRLRVTFGNIGEHFAMVEWRRHLPRPLEANLKVQGTIAEAEDMVQQFRIKVQRVGDSVPKLYNIGPSVCNFRLNQLEPNSEYRVWMCARGYEGVWGPWNEEARVRTLTKLNIEVGDIGEDYVRVSWNRGGWSGETIQDGPNSTILVRQVDGAASEYQIRIRDRNGEVVSINKASYSETTVVVSDLQLNSLFSVEVRAKDTYDEWGLWSEAKRFVTLKAVTLNLLRFGETFMDVEWARCGVLKPEQLVEKLPGDNLIEGNSDARQKVGKENSDDEEDSNDDSSDLSTSLRVTFEEEETTPYPEDAILPDETVTQWHIRFICKRLYSGMPKEDEFEEFYTEPDVIWKRIAFLISNSYYTVFVRAKNKANQWGHWSPPLYVMTYPLLQVELDLVGETFINMSWSRPPMKDPMYIRVACFPEESDIHNYEVSIHPMASESPFREEDEPLTNGARLYETTQPSLRLGNLTSGTRYMVEVREQHVGDDGKAIESWGAFSEICYLETSAALKVLPVEIGEDYCLVEWIRAVRPPDEEAKLFVTHHLEKVDIFELRTKRLNDDAVTVYEGQLALDNTLQLPPSSSQYHIDALLQATIYVVQVRGRGESGTWGPWSPTMKFISQSRLSLGVQAVYETSFYVRWSRPLPSWATQLQQDAASAPSGRTRSRRPSEEVEQTPLQEVLLGDYSIDKYELVVTGISCSLSLCLTLDSTELTRCVSGLEHNQMYCVCVRSLSQKQHWSMFSNKMSVLTLQPLIVTAARCTEDACVLRWHRVPSDLTEFSSLLEKSVAEAQRQCDERERRDLFELKRHVQEMESRGEKVSGWIDQETRQEHNKFLRKEAVQHILLENVHLGDTENTSFHLQLLGNPDCYPIVMNESMLRRPVVRKKERVKGGVAAVKRSTFVTEGLNTSVAAVSSPEVVLEDSALLPTGVLIDMKLFPHVSEVHIQGLRPNSDYSGLVRSCNVMKEWQSWSSPATLHTFCPVKLDQSRFGEHYINLFWHRMAEESFAQMERDMAIYAALQDEFAQYAGKGDLEAKREGMNDEEHTAFLSRLNQFKALHLRITELKRRLADGKAELLIHPQTPISHFIIRIIQESGEYLQYKVPRTVDGSAFTVTGLLPNCMYSCLLCPCYGENFWGLWTSPLKFMTQNLIQLKLTYVAESFVDIEWYRMANKQPPPLDGDDTILSSIFSEEEQMYQLRIEFDDPQTGERVEEMRDMKACNVFRVDGLQPDTKYTIAVREWDAKGDWGLWCTSRTCVTLPGMYTSIEDVGEDWAVVNWQRYETRIDYDNDMRVFQSGVQTVSVYLRVVELLADSEAVDTYFTEDNSNKDELRNSAELDIGGFFAGKKQREGPLPPKKHPEETEELEGRYVLIKHFDMSTSEFKLTNLKPDRFYVIQVLSETTGGQLGMWSSQRYMLTQAKIVLSVQRIDEQYIDIEWERPPPRRRPGLENTEVYVGSYTTVTYELEAEGLSYSLVTSVPPESSSFRLQSLALDSVYISRIRSINTKSQISLWSDLLCVATLSPVVVTPVQITESSLLIEWGRPEQDPNNYPPTDTPLQIGSRVSSAYHLRIGQVTSEEGISSLFERQFPGDVQQLHIPNLLPNSGYVVCATAANEVGEWGLWSVERCLHTMQLLRGVVAAVGETYVRLCWERPPPDEIIQVFETEESEERVCLFPVRDKPTTEAPVYNSMYTKVITYAILVKSEEESEADGEGYCVEVSGEECTCTLPNLLPEHIYHLSVKAFYESKEWGPYSTSIATCTYNPLVLDVKDAGEDYLAATWQRIPNEINRQVVSMGKVEETVCYEVGVYDLTESTLSDDGFMSDAAEMQEWFICSLFVPRKQRHCMAKDLCSNHRYGVAVRRWYEPNERFLKDCPPQEPNTEDVLIQELIERRHAVPGAWSNADMIVTLKDMVCIARMIGENDFSVQFERDPKVASIPLRKAYTPQSPLVYQIMVDELEYDGSEINSAPETFHANDLISAPESTFTAKHLKPDCVYKAEVRCSCVKKIWGRWSKPLYIITQPKIQIEVKNIGEDTASLAWQRPLRSLILPGDIQAVSGENDVTDKIQLELEGVGFSYELRKSFNGTRTTYNVKHLEPNSLYSIRVRSFENLTNAWSLWSDKVHFATLKPLIVKVGYPAEQFVHVDWGRELQQPENFGEMVEGHIVVSEPSVIAYHLCVFQTQESPAVAVLDRQFQPDVSHYRIHALHPDTPYVVIVRACYSDSRWGLWSQEEEFQTQSLFYLQVEGIGENYVELKWERAAGTRVTGVAVPTAYLILVKSDSGVHERVVDAVDCGVTEDDSRLPCYRFTGLTSGTEYKTAIQPLYGDDKGMWSNGTSFQTLASLTIHVETIAGGYQLNWKRKAQVSFVDGKDEKKQEIATAAPCGEEGMPADVAHSATRTVLKYAFAACHEDDAEIVFSDMNETSGDSFEQEVDGEKRKKKRRHGQDHEEGSEENEGEEEENDEDEENAAEVPLEIPQPVSPPDMRPSTGDTVNEGISGEVSEQERDGNTEKLSPRKIDSERNEGEGVGGSQELGKLSGSEEDVNALFKISRDLDAQEDDTGSCCLQDLEADVRYLIRVRAMDDRGHWGSWVSASIVTPPLPPRGLVLRKVNAQFCALQWEPVPDQQNELIYYVEQNFAEIQMGKKKDSHLMDWREVEVCDETVCPIRISSSLPSMLCRIRCQHKGDLSYPRSEYSDLVGITSGTPPEPVTELTVVALLRYGVTLEWKAPPRPEVRLYTKPVYNVYLRKEVGPFMLVANVSQTTHTLNDLTPETLYEVQVVAENSDGVSYSNPIIRFITKEEDDPKIYVPDSLVPLGEIVDKALEFQNECLQRKNGAIVDAEIPCANFGLRPVRPKGSRGAAGRKLLGKGKKGVQGYAADGERAGRLAGGKKKGKGSSKKRSKSKNKKGKGRSKRKSKSGSKDKKESLKLPPIVKQ